MDKHSISAYFKSLQDQICVQLEQADGKEKFIEDTWVHSHGGGGRTRTISNGNIIEKGGVGFSAVEGRLHPAMQQALQIQESMAFMATGVSIVLHPFSPMVPIIHMNVRYFELENGKYWFGGGIDLTPHIVDEADARFFHNSLKSICDTTDKDWYNTYKTWADDYFYIPHRNETRGIGGIFFDHLNETKCGLSKDKLFEFVKRVGESFVPTYGYFMQKNHQLPYTEQDKQWQYLRRGRYVEFNLLYDRGTKFGLDSGGRTESILMSMPPMANWQYNFTPQDGSRHETTLNLLKKGIDWV